VREREREVRVEVQEGERERAMEREYLSQASGRYTRKRGEEDAGMGGRGSDGGTLNDA
jgi:hypothetical protein